MNFGVSFDPRLLVLNLESIRVLQNTHELGIILCLSDGDAAFKRCNMMREIEAVCTMRPKLPTALSSYLAPKASQQSSTKISEWRLQMSRIA